VSGSPKLIAGVSFVPIRESGNCVSFRIFRFPEFPSPAERKYLYRLLELPFRSPARSTHWVKPNGSEGQSEATPLEPKKQTEGIGAEVATAQITQPLVQPIPQQMFP
jgi:hypothetical protein